MEDLEFKIEDGGLWIEDRQSRFDKAKPTIDTRSSVHSLSRITLF